MSENPDTDTLDIMAGSVREEDLANLRAAQQCATMPRPREQVAYDSVPAMLAEQVRTRPDQPWLIYYPCQARDEQPATITYADFAQRVHRTASCFQSVCGLRPGDAVATILRNQPVTVAAYFAGWHLGLRVVPINPAETDDRIVYIIENSKARLVIAHGSLVDRLAGLGSRLGEHVRRAVACEAHESVPPLPAGWEDFSALLAQAPPTAPPPAGRWDSPALIVYTSGTTGLPKGVVLNQSQLLVDAHGIARWHRIPAGSVMMNVLPIHHVNGTVVTLLTPMYAGASVVLNRQFQSPGFWEKMARHRVGIVSVVPTLLQFLLEAGEPVPQPMREHFRHFICGAGPLTVELAREFQETFRLRIVHGYGLSETTCYSCFLPVDLPWDLHCRWMYDHGFPSIGVPIEVNEMAIHDSAGRPLPPGQRGEIVIRGPNVMEGYFANPQANHDTFLHGWFRSGDEGFFLTGDDGLPYFFITGRIKEIIIRGGVNISPFEIDEALCAIPGVRVGLAVGFDNKYYGEEIGAYVQLEPGANLTEQDILNALRDRLPFAKRPKVVLFGEDIPVTSTGKYQRGRLRDRFARWKDVQFRES